MSAIDALVRYLEAEDVKYIFGISGGAIIPLYETLFERARIEPVLTKHEEGAAFMAHGYARVSRRIGVCCTTTGPGGTNAVTGIAAAHADSVPVLLLTAQVSTRVFGMGAFQESTMFGVDLVEIYKPITKLSIMVPRAEQMPTLIQRALRTALTGRPGPVHLNLPADIVKQEIDHSMVVPSRYRPTSLTMDYDAVAKVAELLLEAEAPCILVGTGALLSGAWDELRQLVEQLRIPVATTPKAKGILPENHPLSLGVFGFGGHPLADLYIMSGRIDVLVVIGTSLGEWSTHAWDARIKPTKAFVQIDIDPVEIGKNYPVDVGVVGDAGAVLSALNQQINFILSTTDVVAPFGRLREPPAESNRAFLDRLRANAPRHYDAGHDGPPNGLLKAHDVILTMREVLPDDTLLFVDIGNCISWAGHYYEARRPNTYFSSLGLASMGHAVSAAIGGKLAAPERLVAALVGDGAFAMNGMEVHTAVEHKVAVIWIVLNDSGHGMVYHGQKLLVGRDIHATRFHHALDIRTIAAGLGARSFRCETLESFRSALQEAVTRNAPCVIDAIIDREEIPSSLKHRVKTLDKFFHNTPSASPTSIRIPTRSRR
jgi:acetolactate synthase I/II/III large subunit